MDIAVKNPERLDKSAFSVLNRGSKSIQIKEKSKITTVFNNNTKNNTIKG